MVQSDSPRGNAGNANANANAADALANANAGALVSLQDLPVGSKVRMRGGVIAEVTANPRDGGWLFIRFLEYPSDPSKVGADDMVFCADVIGEA